jgi:hypothetical protein
LINDGDTTRAVEVLDRCIELTPHEKIPYDYNIIQIAAAYYKCRQYDKANSLVEQLAAQCDEKLEYYLDQDFAFVSAINDEILYNFQVLQNLISTSNSNGQEELNNKLEDMTNKRYEVYTTMIAAGR